MLRYRPNFCCNCGEKIERLDWPFWSGRRFCELCETDYWLYDAAPMLVVGVVGLLGILGFAGVFHVERKAAVPAPSHELVAASTIPTPLSVPKTAVQESQSPGLPAVPLKSAVGNQPAKTNEKAADQPSYTCGAMTKKGTACSRRVKTAGERCWQHKGMLAMEPVPRP